MDIAPVSYPEIPLPRHYDWLVNTVTWFREFEEQGIIAKITAIVIEILAVLVLALSIIGIPLLIALANEYERQEETPKARAVFEQNVATRAQQFFHEREDIFDGVNPYLTTKDLQQLALTSRSFYSLVHTNTLQNRREDWFTKKGFTIVDPDKSMDQHLRAYKYLNDHWHFSPKMIEILGGVMKVYEFPTARDRTFAELSGSPWPFPDDSVITGVDSVTNEHYIAFRFKVAGLEGLQIEIYKVDTLGSISALTSVTGIVGVHWIEFPPKLFLERLERVVKKEQVGLIFRMASQWRDALNLFRQNQEAPNRGIIPFVGVRLPIETEALELQLV